MSTKLHLLIVDPQNDFCITDDGHGNKGTLVVPGADADMSRLSHLIHCALSLLVTQDPEDAATAQTLLQAAHRVVGLAPAKPRAEEARPASATDSPEDGRWNYAQAAAKALADADAARQAEAENASKRPEERLTFTARFNSGYGGATISIDGHSMLVAGAQADALAEALRPRRAQVQRLTDDIDTWFSWAIKLAGPDWAQRSASILRDTISARLADSKGQRLKVARDCLPSGVDIIACPHDDKPTTYKASNTDDEHDTPEAAVRAAWMKHIANRSGVISAPSGSIVFDSIVLPSTGSIAPAAKPHAFKVGDKVRFARVHPDSASDGRPPLGWMGSIVRCGEGTFPIKVQGPKYDGDAGAPWWLFAAESLDLVTPTA